MILIWCYYLVSRSQLKNERGNFFTPSEIWTMVLSPGPECQLLDIHILQAVLAINKWKNIQSTHSKSHQVFRLYQSNTSVLPMSYGWLATNCLYIADKLFPCLLNLVMNPSLATYKSRLNLQSSYLLNPNKKVLVWSRSFYARPFLGLDKTKCKSSWKKIQIFVFCLMYPEMEASRYFSNQTKCLSGIMFQCFCLKIKRNARPNNNLLITYNLPVCYLLRIQQYNNATH